MITICDLILMVQRLEGSDINAHIEAKEVLFTIGETVLNLSVVSE